MNSAFTPRRRASFLGGGSETSFTPIVRPRTTPRFNPRAGAVDDLLSSGDESGTSFTPIVRPRNVPPTAPAPAAPSGGRTAMDIWGRFARGAIGFHSALGSVAGADNPYSAALEDQANFYDTIISPAERARREAEAAEVAALGPDASFLDRLLLKGRQSLMDPIGTGAEVAGNVAGALSVAPVLGAAGLSAVAGSVGLGAVAGAGAVKQNIFQTIMSAPDADLMSDPEYAALRNARKSEAEAKAIIASKRQSYVEAAPEIATGAVVGGLSGRYGAEPELLAAAGLGRSAVRAELEHAAANASLKGAGIGFLKEASTEGAQEGIEQLLGNVGAAGGGARVDPMQGVPESVAAAGIMGGLSGPGMEVAGGIDARRRLAAMGPESSVPSVPSVPGTGTGEMSDFERINAEGAAEQAAREASRKQALLEGRSFAPTLQEALGPDIQRAAEDQVYAPLLEADARRRSTIDDLLNAPPPVAEIGSDIESILRERRARSEAQTALENQAYAPLLEADAARQGAARSEAQLNLENQYYRELLQTPAGAARLVDELHTAGLSWSQAIKAKDRLKEELLREQPLFNANRVDQAPRPAETPGGIGQSRALEGPAAVVAGPVGAGAVGGAEIAGRPSAPTGGLAVGTEGQGRPDLSTGRQEGAVEERAPQQEQEEPRKELADGVHADIVAPGSPLGFAARTVGQRIKTAERQIASTLEQLRKAPKDRSGPAAAYRQSLTEKLAGHQAALETAQRQQVAVETLHAIPKEDAEWAQTIADNLAAARVRGVGNREANVELRSALGANGLDPTAFLAAHEAVKSGRATPETVEKYVRMVHLAQSAEVNIEGRTLTKANPTGGAAAQEIAPTAPARNPEATRLNRLAEEVSILMRSPQDLRESLARMDTEDVRAIQGRFQDPRAVAAIEERLSAPAADRRGAEPELRAPVGRFLEDHPDATRAQLDAEIKRLRKLSLTDHLSGLGNKRAMEESEKTAGAVSSGDSAGLKWINDTYGHEGGDRFLKMIGDAVAEISNDEGFRDLNIRGFRSGGDEFVIHGDEEDAVREAAAAISEMVSRSKIHVTEQDGSQTTLTGFTLDFGTGKTFSIADAQLKQLRADKEAAGTRNTARGGRPFGLVEEKASADRLDRTPEQGRDPGDHQPTPAREEARPADTAPQAAAVTRSTPDEGGGGPQAPGPSTAPTLSVSDVLDDTATKPFQRPEQASLVEFAPKEPTPAEARAAKIAALSPDDRALFDDMAEIWSEDKALRKLDRLNEKGRQRYLETIRARPEGWTRVDDNERLVQHLINYRDWDEKTARALVAGWNDDKKWDELRDMEQNREFNEKYRALKAEKPGAQTLPDDLGGFASRAAPVKRDLFGEIKGSRTRSVEAGKPINPMNESPEWEMTVAEYAQRTGAPTDWSAEDEVGMLAAGNVPTRIKAIEEALRQGIRLRPEVFDEYVKIRRAAIERKAEKKTETGLAKAPALFVQIGDRRFEVRDFEDASKRWEGFRDATMRAGAMGSNLPRPVIVDQDGKEVARIAQNGKIFPPAANWREEVGQKPLYDPSAPVTVDAAAAQAEAPKSEAQAEAGNYKKGHTTVNGLRISIENEAGSKRRPEWPALTAHYGYILDTMGKDKDHVDVFLKPGLSPDYNGPVFVVNQHVNGKFDEHKVMLGWPDEKSARRAYLANYSKGWKGLESMAYFPDVDQFRDWLIDGSQQKPAPVVKPEEQAEFEAKPPTDDQLEKMGREAFEKGLPAQPVKDTALMEVVGKLNPSQKNGNAMLHAWLRGWHRANVAAPVPGVTEGTKIQTAGERIATLAEAVADQLETDEGIKNNAALRELANEAFMGTRAEGAWSPRDAYDALEMGVSRYLQRHKEILRGKPEVVLGRLREIMQRLPTQTDRTREQTELQQFSTPPTEGYVAVRAAKIRPGEVVLEPSAGTGSLAVMAQQADGDVTVNEIAPRRVEVLKGLGFDRVTTIDAEHLNALLPPEIKPDVVVMNPPFSATGGRVATNQTKFGARHVEQALARLKPGGRLVAIVGQGMALDRPAFVDWWKRISAKYDVRANLGIPGEEYGKYGTTFGNQLLVIDKVPGRGLANTRHGAVPSLEEALNVIESLDRPNARKPLADGDVSGVRGPGEKPQEGGAAPGRGRRPGGLGAPRNPGVQPGGPKPAGGPVSAVPEGGRPGPAEGVAARGPEEVRGPVRDVDGNPAAGNGSRVAEPFTPKNLTEAQAPKRATVGVGFTEARPQRLDTAGMARHPGSIVEPDSLASVVPPKITYKPMLGDVISNGLISDLQAEPVIYAGQRHEQTLPSGQRAGYLVGDGTGVGKGRTLAAIALDNYRQGRKRTMWVSVGWTLASQVRGDLKNVGAGDIPFLRLDDYGPADEIKAPEGVLFTTYSTFKQKERYEQLRNWLGDDPVILFDEAHQAKNLVTDQGEPTAVGLAVQKIQDETPQARVVYASATSATEPKDMAYMNRLGLWGVGTAFPKFNDFRSALDAGGVGAMEMASRDMKAMGLGVARALSMKDVQFQKTEHVLTKEQTEMYDRAATIWQNILSNIDDAIDQTQGGSRARSRAMSQFYSAMQRFFKQIASSYKVPTLIKRIESELSDGKSVVVRFVSTAQDAVEGQVAKARAEGLDLEDLDLTPRDTIANYLEKSFPTTLYEEYTDPDTGMKISRPVLDAQGNEVQDPDAVAMRDDLMRQISDIVLPETALDQLVRHFGVKQVAEVTGRTKQLVVDDATGKRKYISRSPKAMNPAERDAFQAGKKRILLMNDAGGTGMDAHASNDFKNKQQRVYFIYETGWSADKEMQGLGRVNRTNQASAPIYDLLHTNLPGERRFMSTIARRLGQLGALTRGERSATKAGGLSDYDFENDYGKAAVAATYRDLEPDVIRRMGFQKEGQVSIKEADRTDVPKFLNRVLALQVKDQEETFAIFEKHLENVIAAAKANGTFDEGVSDIRAESIHQVGKETLVHTDEASGAETKHVELEAKIKTHPLPWTAVSGENDYTFFTNKQSGRVFAIDMARGTQRTNPTLTRVETYYPARRPNGTYDSIPQSHLYGYGGSGRFTENAKTAARPLWEKEFEDTPKHRLERLHYITGATLPIWDKLKAASKDSGRLKVERAITDDGRRVIGVRIPTKSVSEVLKAMNIKTKASDSMEVFRSVLDNGQTVKLDKGLGLTRVSVGREPRIEVTGVDARTGKLLAETFGLAEEKIAFKYRYFIPTDERAAKPILDKFLKAYPTIDAGDETKFATAPKAESRAAKPVVPIETVQKAIPGLNWKPSVNEFGDPVFYAQLAGGRMLLLEPNSDDMLRISNSESFRRSALAAGKNPADVVSRGAYTAFGLGREALIRIAEAAPDGTIEHEGLHFLWDVALTPEEKSALLKKYGGEEEAAYAFEKWLTDRNRRPSTWFQKVLDWVRRVVHYFRPTWESTFGEAASGRAARRVAGESTGRGGFSVKSFDPDQRKSGVVESSDASQEIDAQEAYGERDEADEGEPPSADFQLAAIGDLLRRPENERPGRYSDSDLIEQARGVIADEGWRLPGLGNRENPNRVTERMSESEVRDLVESSRAFHARFFKRRPSGIDHLKQAKDWLRKQLVSRGQMHPDARFAVAPSTETPEFKRWFGDSKAVDENGKPLVAYHGTPTGGFTVFDPDRQSSKGGRARGGFSFTTDPEAADAYANSFEEQQNQVDEVVLAANKVWRSMDSKWNEDLAEEFGSEEIAPEWDPNMADDGLEEAIDWTREAADILEARGFEKEAKAMRAAGDVRTEGKPKVYEVYLKIPKESPEFHATKKTLGEVVWKLDVRRVPGRAATVHLEDGSKIFYVADSNQVKLTDNAQPTESPDIRYATFTPAKQSEETRPEAPKPQKPKLGRSLPSGPGRPLRVGPMDVDDLTRRVIAAREGEGTPDGTPVEQMNHPEFHNNFKRVLQVLPKEDAEWLTRLYDVFRPEFAHVSEKMTWEQGDREALKLLNIYDRDQFLQAMQRGVVFNEPGLRAATRIMYEVDAENKAAVEALRAAKEQGGGGPNSEEFKKVAETSVNVAAWALALRGEKNEAGRAFGARRDLRGARTDSEKLLGRLFKEIGGLTEEQAAEVVRLAEGNPEKLPDFVRKMFRPSFWDYINEYRKASMLSAVRTYGVNFFGNALKQIMSATEIPFAAGVDAARSIATGEERRVYAGEVAAARAGLVKYGPDLWKRFIRETLDAFSGVEHYDPEDSRPYEMQVGVIPGPAGKVIRTIFRLMASADTFFKGTAEAQSLYRQAYRRARNEGLTDGNAAKRVDELIAIGEGSDWTDHRVAGMKERARRAAQYETFTLPANWENSGAFGLMANLVSHAEKKFKPVGLFVPFKGTPANIAYQSFERSPLGWWAVKNRYQELAQVRKRLETAVSGAEKRQLEAELNSKAEEFANQFARAAMGSAVFGIAMAAALAGNLTGSGPADPDKRRVWQKAGHIPTAVKVGDSQWYAYDRFEPAAASIALAAGIPDVIGEKGVQNKVAAFVNAMQDAWVSKTYLQGLEQLADVMTDPTRYSQKWLRDLTGSFVPAFLGQTTEVVDPTVRDATGGLLDPLKARIPGLSDELPATRTGTGEPATRTERLFGGGPLNPFGFIRTGPSTADPLYKEFEQAGYAPDPHNRYIMVGVGPTGRKVQHRVDLTPQELELFRRADEAVTRRLWELIKRPEWRDLDPTIKKQEFSKLYSRGSNRVRAAILPRVAARLREQLSAGGADAR